MLPIVEVKRSFIVSRGVRFFYTTIMIFAILLCATFYVMNSMEIGGNPTQTVVHTAILHIAPPLPSEKVVSKIGEVTPPNLDLYEQLSQSTLSNDDTVGWLKVPNTNIDYPVVQSEDNSYYLRRGFDERYSFVGILFADYRVIGENRKDFYNNTVIYGHNINTNHSVVKGEMFAELMRYKDFEFAKDNQYFYYATLQDEITLEIFSIFYNGVRPNGQPDLYHIEIEELNDDDKHMEFMEEVVSRSEYDFKVELTKEDKIVTLSTCTYKYGQDIQQYLVVMGRIVGSNDDGNKKDITINEDKKVADFIKEHGLS